MSARDTSAIRYVACLVHKRKDRPCRCERCEAIRRVVKLATDYASVRRLLAGRKAGC